MISADNQLEYERDVADWLIDQLCFCMPSRAKDTCMSKKDRLKFQDEII